MKEDVRYREAEEVRAGPVFCSESVIVEEGDGVIVTVVVVIVSCT